MPTRKRKTITNLKRLVFFKMYRRAFVFGCAICLLQIALHTAFAYEHQFTDFGKKNRLRWRNDVIYLSLSNSLRQPAANIKPNSDVAKSVRNSLRTWELAANIKFVTVWSDKVSISQADSEGDKVNLITVAATPENTAPFNSEFVEMPGRTRTFYNKRGHITESDIVLNPYQQFSTDGSFGTFDLEAVLTHEIGHLLGLDHSVALAATMYSQQGRNGTFSLPAIAPRTLAEDDRAGIRLLYDTGNADENCCGAVSGTLTTLDGKQLDKWQVWAEEITTGKLFAVVTTNNNGAWTIGGLPNGKYLIVAQAEKINAEILGTVTVEAGKNSFLNQRISPQRNLFGSFLLGYNGQLSALAITLNPEVHWQSIFIGGNNLLNMNSQLKKLTIGSPFLQIFSDSLVGHDFNSPISVASFNLNLDSALPNGEYNLQIQNSNGEKVYLLGCFTVEQN